MEFWKMVNHATILKKVMEKQFPEEKTRERVSGILGRYGVAGWQQEKNRVRLAILKLAGSNIEMIQYFTMQACRDYRDILAMAEYPNQTANPYIMKNDPEGSRELQQEDLQQYEDWYLGIIWERGEGETSP
jgi:hypothetical protein